MIESISLVAIAVAVSYSAIGRPGLEAARRAPSRSARPSPPLPAEPVSLAGAQTRGSATAKVALVVYSDFQCPFCGKFAREALPKLEHQYVDTGKVLVAFRQYPLDIHAFAEKAAEGSLCAGRQGRFWPFHDDLFGNQQALDAASLQARAERLGLNTALFSACLSGEMAGSVQGDKKDGLRFGITGTPTFLAGQLVAPDRVKVSERFSGALPIERFQTVLDGLLRKAGVSTTAP